MASRSTGTTVYEFDALVEGDPGAQAGVHQVPSDVYAWLEKRALASDDPRESAWLRITQRNGRRAVQVTSFVGVVRAPNGYQIEVLPKIGRVLDGGPIAARWLLIEMVSSLPEMRHLRTDAAKVLATRMPLLEVFVAEFLRAVEHVVKRGLRSDYAIREGNVFALRGKWLLSSHLRQNMYRADRFYAEYDEYTSDRAENRLLHAALRRVLQTTTSSANQRLARELEFVFTDIPPSNDARLDFQLVRADRGMSRYADALAWTRLILDEESPLTGMGPYGAPSLLFPMEVVFEAFVGKHLARQMIDPRKLRVQARTEYLVRHRGEPWFRLKPDFLVREAGRDVIVLDTKWKLLDRTKDNSTDKYGISSADFYQLQAYGLSYLDAVGDVVLIYPRTNAFDSPLAAFEFPRHTSLRLWIVPFCLDSRRLVLPGGEEFARHFVK